MDFTGHYASTCMTVYVKHVNIFYPRFPTHYPACSHLPSLLLSHCPLQCNANDTYMLCD